MDARDSNTLKDAESANRVREELRRDRSGRFIDMTIEQIPAALARLADRNVMVDIRDQLHALSRDAEVLIRAEREAPCQHCGHPPNPLVTRSVVVDQPGHPVSAVCALTHCQHFGDGLPRACLTCEGHGVVRERIDLAGAYSKHHCPDCLIIIAAKLDKLIAVMTK